MLETKVNLDNVLALLNLAENNPETLENVELESSQSSPPRTRASSNKLADGLADGLAAFKRLFESDYQQS